MEELFFNPIQQQIQLNNYQQQYFYSFSSNGDVDFGGVVHLQYGDNVLVDDI